MRLDPPIPPRSPAQLPFRWNSLVCSNECSSSVLYSHSRPYVLTRHFKGAFENEHHGHHKPTTLSSSSMETDDLTSERNINDDSGEEQHHYDRTCASFGSATHFDRVLAATQAEVLVERQPLSVLVGRSSWILPDAPKPRRKCPWETS